MITKKEQKFFQQLVELKELLDGGEINTDEFIYRDSKHKVEIKLVQ